MDELTLTDIVAAASLPSGGGSKKKTTNTCRQDGCQNIVVRGKLCYKHLPLPSSTFCMPIGTATVGGGGGGIVDGVDNSIKYQDGRDKHGHKNCSHPSCENIVVQGGVCLKHGARKQLCTYINPLTNEVCTNLAKQGGVCTRHGARREARKQCSHVDPESGEQCTKVARKGGTCIRHGSIERTCAFEGCVNNIVNNGVCKRHGAIVKICKFDGCDNQVKKRGLCVRHQSASPDECGEVRTISQCVPVEPPKYNDPNNNIDKHNRAICNFEGGCTNVAHRRGLCIRHGNPQNYYKKKANSKKDKDEIPKPYTEYTMFFKLEQALFTQEDGEVGEEIVNSLDWNHQDELEFPRPERYQDIIMAPYWYSSQHKKEIEKKRKHRKRAGRMNLTELSKSISVNWRNASDEVVAYCKKLAMAEKLKYGMIMELAMKEKKKVEEQEELARAKKERDTVQQLVNAQQYRDMMNAADFPQVTMGMFSRPAEKKVNFPSFSAHDEYMEAMAFDGPANKSYGPPSSEPINSIFGGDEAAAASALFTLRKTGGKRDASSMLSTAPMEEGPPMKTKKIDLTKPMQPSPFGGHAASHSVRPASSRVRPTSPATNPMAHFQHNNMPSMSLTPTVHSGFQSGTSTSAIMTAMMNESRRRGFQSGMLSMQNQDTRNSSFGGGVFPARQSAFPSAQPMWNYPQPNQVQGFQQSDAFRAILAMRAAREESAMKVALAREAVAREESSMKVAMAREAVAKANEQLMKANKEFQKVHSSQSQSNPSPDAPMKRRSSFNSAA